MNFCLFILLASLFVCQINAMDTFSCPNPLKLVTSAYYNIGNINKCREHWEIYRRPLENAIINALKDSVGFGNYGMNVYVRKPDDGIAIGYYHNDNQVRLILQDLTLNDHPRVWQPDVQLSLVSNVLKLRAKLSKMIVQANYVLMRNKTYIIHEPKDQDPYKSSPFLFEQVQDAGRVAITIEDCKLSGFIITPLTGNSVHVGFQYLSLTDCQYTMEIYRPGEDSPPVIAKYNLVREDEPGLGLKHLLMSRVLEEELVPKLQTALNTYINTSAIFGEKLESFKLLQGQVFYGIANYLEGLVSDLKRATIQMNNGAIDMDDYFIQWDEGRIRNSSAGESLELSEMVLTGLETLYSAHIGGPFKIDSVKIAEELRFSSLQVRGRMKVKSIWLDTFRFTAEINDLAFDLILGHLLEGNENIDVEKLKVKGFRNMVLTMHESLFEAAEGMIGGYLMNVVPNLIYTHLATILPKCLNNPSPQACAKTSFYPIHNSENFLEGTDDNSEEKDYSHIPLKMEETLVNPGEENNGGMEEDQRTKRPRRTPRTRRPRSPRTRRPGSPRTRLPGSLRTRLPGSPWTMLLGSLRTRRPGSPRTRLPGSPRTRRPGRTPRTTTPTPALVADNEIRK